MRSRRAGVGGLALVAVGCLALGWAPAARAQVKLEYKFPEGNKLTYKTTTKMHQSLTINGMEIPTDLDQTLVASQTVGKRRGDASLPVTSKVESVRTELTLPGGINIAFDSSNPNAKIEPEPVAFLGEVFKLASEISYTLVLDAQNKVKAIEGTEKLLEKADKLSPQGRDAIRSQLEADKLKRQFEQSHRNLPDVLARPGEPWERDEIVDIGGGQTLSFHKKYEYVGTEKRGDKTLDKITSKALEVKYSMDPDAPNPLKVTKSDLKIESSSGTILFDREAGCVVESTEKSQIKGSMSFSINGQDLPGELDLTIENKEELQPAAK
jgi:hypothetical protein